MDRYFISFDSIYNCFVATVRFCPGSHYQRGSCLGKGRVCVCVAGGGGPCRWVLISMDPRVMVGLYSLLFAARPAVQLTVFYYGCTVI